MLFHSNGGAPLSLVKPTLAPFCGVGIGRVFSVAQKAELFFMGIVELEKTYFVALGLSAKAAQIRRKSCIYGQGSLTALIPLQTCGDMSESSAI